MVGFVSRTWGLGFAALAMSLGSSAALAKGQYSVTIGQMRYAPMPANLHVGDKITFVNKDTLPHTVTARDNSFNLRLPPGKSATLTLGKAGAFNFYCIYHPTMRGILRVAS
jgi:plastocyanin